MGRTELPASVRNLIERHLESAADVETLLLLCQEVVWWNAVAVARELRIDRDQAAGILDRLSRTGLLGRGDDGTFRYEPRRPKIAEAVAQLVQLYPAYRVAIVSEIYARPSGPIRDFSEAFRMRRED